MSDEHEDGVVVGAEVVDVAAEAAPAAPMNGATDGEAAKEVPEGRRIVRIERRPLKVPFNEEARRSLDERIGQLGLRRRDALLLEAERKDAHKVAKEARESIDSQIAELALEMGEGGAVDQVEVSVEIEFATNTVRERRLDTGELLEERAATPEERQEEMRLVPPKDDGSPPPDNVVPLMSATPMEDAQALREPPDHIQGASDDGAPPAMERLPEPPPDCV